MNEYQVLYMGEKQEPRMVKIKADSASHAIQIAGRHRYEGMDIQSVTYMSGRLDPKPPERAAA